MADIKDRILAPTLSVRWEYLPGPVDYQAVRQGVRASSCALVELRRSRRQQLGSAFDVRHGLCCTAGPA
jgi:hypothetical protein